jgi:transcriptional antiterminator RfaH
MELPSPTLETYTTIGAHAHLDGGTWYACHTRPRCEKKFAALMAAEEFEHYLPLIEHVQRYAKQTRRFTKPLFAGYVFARVPANGKNRIYQMELIARAIPVDNEARFLVQLDQVRKMVSSGLEMTVVPLLKRGRQIRILGGPLNGLVGFVDDPSNPKGIVISVDVLRQGLLLKMPAENLRAVG